MGNKSERPRVSSSVARRGDPNGPVVYNGGFIENCFPIEFYRRGFARPGRHFCSPFWIGQGTAVNRAAHDWGRNRLRGNTGYRTIVPELPLRANRLAVVQLRGAVIVAH